MGKKVMSYPVDWNLIRIVRKGISGKAATIGGVAADCKSVPTR